jgi:hypothetical protein
VVGIATSRMSCVDVNPKCAILEGEPRVEMGPAMGD